MFNHTLKTGTMQQLLKGHLKRKAFINFVYISIESDIVKFNFGGKIINRYKGCTVSTYNVSAEPIQCQIHTLTTALRCQLRFHFKSF